MIKIAIDAGHGTNTPGKRTPAGEREWSFNNKVVVAAIAELRKYQGVEILRLDDPTGRTDISLRDRTNAANRWGADFLWSKHFNAITGVWGNHTGTETYTFNGNKSHNSESVRIARVLHQAMLKAWGLRDRGVKTANFHMVREPNCPAVLTEGGFMDSNIDIKVMRDDVKLAEGGRQMARALANYFNLKLNDNQSDVYTVKSGDTLWGIATSHKVTVDNLKSWNNLESDLITPGQKLTLKAGTVVQPSTSKPASLAKPAATPKPQANTSVSGARLIKNENGFFLATDNIKVRNAPTTSATHTGTLQKGQSINYKRVFEGNGFRWLEYTGNSGNTLYLPYRRLTGDTKNWGTFHATRPNAQPAPRPIVTGDRVRVNQSASKYATGQNIPARIKGQTYQVLDTKNGQVRLSVINSWLNVQDVIRV